MPINSPNYVNYLKKDPLNHYDPFGISLEDVFKLSLQPQVNSRRHHYRASTASNTASTPASDKPER